MSEKANDDRIRTRIHKNGQQPKSESSSTSTSHFLEYYVPKENDNQEFRTIAVGVVSIAPQHCSRVVKALAHVLPLPPTLQHLKRVRKEKKERTTKPQENTLQLSPAREKDEQPKKRAKTSLKKDTVQLEILLGPWPISELLSLVKIQPDGQQTNDKLLLDHEQAACKLLQTLGDDNVTDRADSNILTHLESILYPRQVAQGPPRSQSEADQANRFWPTTYFPLKSWEHREQQMALSPEELKWMQELMEQNLKYGRNLVRTALVVDPTHRNTLSTSEDEGKTQGYAAIQNNPLATPIFLAIQGISRLERKQYGHYLCSGYWMVCNYEPTIVEAMACVHARMGRILFCEDSKSLASSNPREIRVWQQAISKHAIHDLPGTNHHFRAFEYRPN